MCRELTGLGVHEASVSVGRCFHANLDAIIELHALLKPALLPLRECTPARLRGCVEALLRDSSDISGRRQTLGWATALLRRLINVLDWEVVLAHARHADPAQAEEHLARIRRGDVGASTGTILSSKPNELMRGARAKGIDGPSIEAPIFSRRGGRGFHRAGSGWVAASERSAR